jgi:non-specific serine/threonine protein kinase
LIATSFLRQEAGRDGEPRYRMLETIREFGLERLRESGEESTQRRRLADWALSLAASAAESFSGPEQIAWIRRLDAEHDNLTDVLAWATSPGGDPALALRLGEALDRYWYVRGLIREGRAWVDRVLAVGGPELVPPQTYARLLNTAGMFADAAGDDATARTRYEEALAFARAHGERHIEAYALLFLAGCSLGEARDDEATALLEEGTAILRSLGSPKFLASAAHTLGQFVWYRGDLSQAQTLIEESLRGFEEMGHTWAIAILTIQLADLALAQGNLGGAVDRYRAALRLTQEHNSDWGIGFALDGVGCLGVAAGLIVAGVRLHAAGRQAQEVIGTFTSPRDRARGERLVATARAAIGDEVFAAAWEDGRSLLRSEALTEAHRVLDQVEQRVVVAGRAIASPSDDDVRLTPRERDVLRLLVAGRSNREIAEALSVSHRTATTHVTNILTKFGVESRTEAAALAVRRGLV